MRKLCLLRFLYSVSILLDGHHYNFDSEKHNFDFLTHLDVFFNKIQQYCFLPAPPKRRSSCFLIGSTNPFHISWHLYFNMCLCVQCGVYIRCDMEPLPKYASLLFILFLIFFSITLQRYGVSKRKIFHPNICKIFNINNSLLICNVQIARV